MSGFPDMGYHVPQWDQDLWTGFSHAPRVRSSHVSAGKPVLNSHHRDALIHRTNKRTEIAAHALGLIHARNAAERRRIRSQITAAARSLRVTGVSAIDARLCVSRVAGIGCNSTCPSTGPDYTIEMNALMRAIPAGNVAQIAANALLLVDARNNLVIQIQVLPLSHARQRQAAKILNAS